MLRDLKLACFRCFERVEIFPSPGINFFTGANAQGKTSLLEAACILLRLQSPRAGSLSEAVRFDAPGFGLDGHWNDTHLHIRHEGGLRSFAIDSKPQSRSADYLAVGKVAWISNDDIQLIRGSASHRRRYLDFLGAQVVPGYLRALRAYERALRSRNALLKDGRARREVSAFDAPLMEHGEFLLSSRATLSRDLAPEIATATAQIAGPGESAAITYLPGCHGPLANALVASASEEARLRSTVCGPHRDDIGILLNGRDAATFASEGQQRSLALAWKLAQATLLGTTTPPVYLIDDVFGELDRERRNRLLNSLPARAQMLITTTSIDWLTDLEGAAIHDVTTGSVIRRD